MHDGVSPIFVTGEDEDEQFDRLYAYLVPPSGRAQTAQGEIIRIAGRVYHEVWDMGCINSAEILTGYLIANGRGRILDESLCRELCACAVAWVQQNPEVIAPLPADYNR